MNFIRVKVEEEVRRSLLRHRGDVHRVAQDTEIAVQFVRRIWEKMRGKMDRDTSIFVAFNVLGEMLSGRSQRIQLIQDQIDSYQGHQTEQVSECCRKPVYRERQVADLSSTPGLVDQVVEWVDVIKCTSCKKTCNVLERPNVFVHREMRNLIEMLRDEDNCLVNFAEKLGVVAGDRPAPIRLTQHVLVTQGGKQKSKEVDSTVVTQLEKLEPRDRQKLRRSLQKQMEGLPDDETEEHENTV